MNGKSSNISAIKQRLKQLIMTIIGIDRWYKIKQVI